MAQNFYCKWCGTKFPSVLALTSSTCIRNPTKGARHELYEGSEKSQYTCKYCGTKFPSILGMTSSNCLRHPAKGKHEPAL